MYERSAIVLERYMEKIFQFDKKYNLKENVQSYRELLEEIENYQILTEKEGKIIKEFDETAKSIEEIQDKQERLCNENKKLEEARNQLFSDLGEDSKILEKKFKKIEESISNNNEILQQLREEFIKYLSDFSNRQKERNKCEKAKRIGEANHIEYIKKVIEEFQSINVKDVAMLKEFISSEKDMIRKELNDIMTKNGKNEKIGFNQDALKIAIKARINVAEKEAECYVLVYDKMKKLLSEVENDSIKLNKFSKNLRDVSVKLAFLESEKEYIFNFLDYERMTTIAGAKVHKKKIEEACQNFELDMIQIHNLYELILREIANKSTKKAYKELYNKTYLKNIQDKEKNFEQEVNNIKINMGTVINSNYWRIEGIKNVYNIFQQQVSENFEKDLSEYQLEYDSEEDNEEYPTNKYSTTMKKSNKKENEGTASPEQGIYDKYEEDDGYYDDEDEEYDDDYDDEEYEEYDDDYDDEEYEEYDDDYDDEEYEEYDDEYDDEEYEEYDDEYDDEEYEEYNDEYDDEEDEEDEEDGYYDEQADDEEYEQKQNEQYNKNTKKKTKNKEKINEIGDDDWEKEIIQQLNRKRTSRSVPKNQKNNIFNKFFKDKKDRRKN